MSTLSLPLGSSLSIWLRGALHRPASPTRPAGSPAASGRWLDRLAAWSDGHPPRHHRVGSYTALLR